MLSLLVSFLLSRVVSSLSLNLTVVHILGHKIEGVTRLHTQPHTTRSFTRHAAYTVTEPEGIALLAAFSIPTSHTQYNSRSCTPNTFICHIVTLSHCHIHLSNCHIHLSHCYMHPTLFVTVCQIQFVCHMHPAG